MLTYGNCKRNLNYFDYWNKILRFAKTISNMIRKGRTLNLTVDELLTSKRLEIAINNFKHDPMFLKAILIELGLECLTVAKNTIIRHYSMYSSLDKYELAPYLRSVNDFHTFNIHFGLSDIEKELYLGDIKGDLSEEKRKELFDKVKKKFMESGED